MVLFASIEKKFSDSTLHPVGVVAALQVQVASNHGIYYRQHRSRYPAMQKQLIQSVVADWGIVTDCRPISGGCISEAARVTVRDPDGKLHDLFVKSNRADFQANFRCEFDALNRLAAIEAIRTPKPLKIQTIGDRVLMVMQWIQTGTTSDFERLGRQLADLHRKSAGGRIGLEYDNFLGASPQFNTPAATWVQFVQENRIGPQLRRATDRGLIDTPTKRDIETLIEAMPTILAGRDDVTSLLHGDLWSGNYLFDTYNQPVVIDPAIYYGCREAEFGMLLLFGGCPPSFYESYNDQWPLPPRWRQRSKVYVLYHLLNHLNLFGATYLSQCGQVAQQMLIDMEN